MIKKNIKLYVSNHSQNPLCVLIIQICVQLFKINIPKTSKPIFIHSYI